MPFVIPAEAGIQAFDSGLKIVILYEFLKNILSFTENKRKEIWINSTERA